MFKSKLLQNVPFIEHTFFGRQNGASLGVFSSLNASFNVGDEIANVEKNRSIIANTFSLKPSNIYCLKQVHSTDIVDISSLESPYITEKQEADGLITKNHNQILSIFTADCMPIMFVDTKNRQIANIHSGWKGLLNGIIENTVSKFASPENLLVAIGPCIAQKSYEVDDIFYSNFIKRDQNYKKFFSPQQNGKFIFDLPSLGVYKLVSSKILQQNIDVLPHDTYENEDLFFSHRRTIHQNETKRGLNASCIVIKNPKKE